jgi:hypothetical protein
VKRAERIATLVMVAVCVYAWFEARRFSPLSALFPQVVVIVLGGLALLLFVSTFVKRGEGKKFVLVEENSLAVALTALMMTGWVALIGIIGFLVSGFVFFPLMSVTLDRRERTVWRNVGRVALTWAVTLAFYYFFDRVLHVSLPRGRFL